MHIELLKESMILANKALDLLVYTRQPICISPQQVTLARVESLCNK